MTVVLFLNSEEEEQTSENTWQDKGVVSGELIEGDYFIHIYCEVTGTQTNRGIGVRVLLDDVEHAFDSKRPVVANAYQACSLMGSGFLTEGIHELKLQYVAESPPQVAKIRRARVLIIKH